MLSLQEHVCASFHSGLIEYGRKTPKLSTASTGAPENEACIFQDISSSVILSTCHAVPILRRSLRACIYRDASTGQSDHPNQTSSFINDTSGARGRPEFLAFLLDSDCPQGLAQFSSFSCSASSFYSRVAKTKGTRSEPNLMRHRETRDYKCRDRTNRNAKVLRLGAKFM